MFVTVLLASASLWPLQDTGKARQDPAAAAQEIQEALKGKDPDAAAGKIKDLGRIADPAVVKAVAEGLSSKEPAVRAAAVAALRFNEAPEALEPLLKLARDKKTMEEPQFAASVYMAIGQKGDPKSLDVLTQGLVVDNGGNRSIQARILAIGRIRSNQAVEQLMNFLVKGKGAQEHPYWHEVNLSLAVLTGQDLGGRDQWQAWWNDNRNKFKVAPKQPDLPQRIETQWRMAWADPEARERGKNKDKDDDKGKDGPG